jgi:uncharacterized protein YjiK
MNNANTKSKLIFFYLLFVFYVIQFSCINRPTEKNNQTADIKSVNIIGYNLSRPDKTIILPGILHEISGITVIDSSSVACVQDEKGIIFIFDPLRDEIKDQIVFHTNGDYEGITLAGNTIYILRSDAVLFEIKNYGSSGFRKEIISTGIPASDIEGLCWDKSVNRLLISPKGNIGKGYKNKEKRPIYGFDLNSGKPVEKPVLEIKLSDIISFAADNKVIHQEKSNKKKKGDEQVIEFKPSAICIHPITNKLFVLSAIEHILFVFDINGRIEYMEMLNPDIFNKPEGISFFKNGDMLISNEGENRYATILRFNYIPN